MKIITLELLVILGFAKTWMSQVLECDRYCISDLRDSTINADPVFVLTMSTDTNTANLGTILYRVLLIKMEIR
jgi:hypothetical protein